MGDSGTDSEDSRRTVVEKATKKKRKNMNIIGNIEHFTPGDCFADYIERVDHIVNLNKIGEAEKVAFLIGVCGADLYKIIKSVIAPKTTVEVSFVELKTALKAYFDPKINVIGERFTFNHRQQKTDESVGDYIMELKSLSRTCEFGTFLDEALRDKLIF